MVPDVVEPERAIDEVAFFPGCLINLRLQNTGLNVIEVLKRNGVRVRIPKDFVCCGSVMFRSGARKTAYELIKKNVEYFRRLGIKKLVGLCPGCMSTIKQDWPIALHQLGEKPYGFEAYDINEYLVDVLGVDKMNLKDLHPVRIKVTYHAPCHLNRHQEISQEPITLLKLVPGLQYIKTDGEDICCGAGGGVRAGRRELSYKIADQKLKRMAKTGADAFVTSCSFCTIQLMDAVKRLNLPQKVYNVADVLAMSYKS
jgi:fumarate reductase (CoM/CoB) subunit B